MSLDFSSKPIVWKTIGPCIKQMEVWTDPSILALSGMKMLIQTP